MALLYREINNQSDLQELQKDLDELSKWDHDWQMHFKPKMLCAKTNTCARNVKRFSYSLGNTTLQETDNHPCLGDASPHI